MTEFAWMIELPERGTGRATWWAGGDNWTTDPNLGVRFARQVDGEAVLRGLVLHAPVGRYPDKPRVLEHWG